ncbi:MAG: putative ABC exporter domain-containing protein, partial [Oscillospiraceae bacterium]|nr:putative ABC exporter domain-containing protein [Oscillospiraceae bacterium]
KGEAIFQMSDVNFLFVSPVNSRKILFYGILRTMKSSFFAGIFVLFMGGLLAIFGIGFGGVLLTFFGVVLSMVVLSVVSLIIYSLTNGNKKRKLAAKIIAVMFYLPAVIYFALSFMNTGDTMTALGDVILSPFMAFVPVAGWMSAGISAFLLGDMLSGFSFVGMNILLGVGLVVYIMLSKPDYYEDALVSTETLYEKLRAINDGDLNAATVGNRKVKVTKTGVSGIGASTLFYKHVRESFRENRFGFITIWSLYIAVIAIAVTFFTKDIILVLQILMWLQIFKIGVGRGIKELYTHYIYMLPEPSFNKIIWSSMEVMFRTLIESVLIFGIGGVLAGINIAVILGCIVTFTMFSFLLVGSNYLSMRTIGENLNKGLMLSLYFLGLAVIMAPGLIPALIIGYGIGGVAGTVVGLIILTAWELIAGLVIFALSKGVLHKCDMPVIKPN